MRLQRYLATAYLVAAAMNGGALAHSDSMLGKLSFPTSCQPSVQAEFERGVAMLHSYWFNYARETFEEVLAQDPSCSMAYWGIAADRLGNSLVGPPSKEAAQAAWEALEQARKIGSKTQRERDWIEALSAYYRGHATVTVESRLDAYNDAMEQMTLRYPEDYEAWVFYTLTLQASAPKSDTTYANQLKSAEILERLDMDNPQHPGVLHYLIHAYDYPPLAQKGLAAARRYSGVAPAVPHARHMPSHIYSMLGLWEESIASNASALEMQPDYYHASDFAVYAHLQLAQEVAARALIDKALAMPERGDRRVSLANFTARAAMPARYMLERGNWAGAAALEPIRSDYPPADSLIRFARGLGMARKGDTTAAQAEIEAIKSLRELLRDFGQIYWADRSLEQILAISAWIGADHGMHDRAVQLMRKAADGEDSSVKHVAMENRLYPMRELLGDLLLEIGRPADALREYEAALEANPGRLRGFFGAARAAERTGDLKKGRRLLRQARRLVGQG